MPHMSTKRTSNEEPPLASKKHKMAEDGVVNGGGAEVMQIDENLHSRQLAVYGREVMRRMAASSVLIIGANGLGVEIGGWHHNALVCGVSFCTLPCHSLPGLPSGPLG